MNCAIAAGPGSKLKREVSEGDLPALDIESKLEPPGKLQVSLEDVLPQLAEGHVAVDVRSEKIADVSQIRIIRHKVNSGYGSAWKTGIRAAAGGAPHG